MRGMDTQAPSYAESVHEAPAHVARPARPKPYDAVPESQAWVDGELLAWGRWTRNRQATVKCGSAEGQYRAPWRQWHYPSMEELMPKPLDAWVWTVDRAVTAQTEMHRDLLTLHYARMCNPYVTCRRLRMRYELFGQAIIRARDAVLNKLRS